MTEEMAIIVIKATQKEINTLKKVMKERESAQELSPQELTVEIRSLVEELQRIDSEIGEIEENSDPDRERKIASLFYSTCIKASAMFMSLSEKLVD